MTGEVDHSVTGCRLNIHLDGLIKSKHAVIGFYSSRSEPEVKSSLSGYCLITVELENDIHKKKKKGAKAANTWH